ncbi:MAG: sarcosine oxidase subunit delta [Halioglobus sp.]|jgi:sarcosine oxidase subunit delta
MKILNCPLNGPRNISEFTYGGEFHAMPDPQNSTSREWAEYVFFHDNDAGVVTEWWCHSATSYWFLAQRNTITDEVVRTFAASEVFTERVVFTDTSTDIATEQGK